MKTSTKVLIAAGVVTGAVVSYKLVQFFTYECPEYERGGATFDQIYAQQIAIKGEDFVTAKLPDAFAKRQIRKPTENVRPILILYGTEYGGSREIAYKLEKKILDNQDLAEKKWWPRVMDMEDFEAIEFEKETLVLSICSTYGDGVPPTSARPFFDAFLGGIEEGQTANKDLSNIIYTVLALGDKNYPFYCRAGKTVDAKFEAQGAKRILARADVDQEDGNVISRWIADVLNVLQSEELINAVPLSSEDYLYEKQERGEFGDETKKGPSRKNPYSAKILEKRLLTVIENEKDPKETIHIELELENNIIEYKCGDALAILPINCPDLVSDILKLWQNNTNPHTQVNTPPWHYNKTETKLTLRDALLQCYDLKNVKPELLVLLKNHAKNEELNKLEKLLADGTSKSNTYLHDTYLYGREVIDIFEEFIGALKACSIEKILSELKQLLPRYYSISSAQKTNPNKVTITVAIVRYNTHNKSRKGVATTYLADRIKVGDKVPVFLSPNPDFRLPEEPSKPIIMVGPGTGIAPFRAFLQERETLYSLEGASTSVGANVLFFGSRNRNLDYLYKEELEKWAAEGKLILSTAFSRETSEKVYVQHRIKENAELLWKLIDEEGAHIYICGDAQYMEPDVRAAIKQLIETHGNKTEEEAEAYIKNLEKSRRFQRDVWF